MLALILMSVYTCTFLIRRQVLKIQDAKPGDPCQKQRWSLNNDGFICLKGTSLVLGLSDASNEVQSAVISILFLRLLSIHSVKSRQVMRIKKIIN